MWFPGRIVDRDSHGSGSLGIDGGCQDVRIGWLAGGGFEEDVDVSFTPVLAALYRSFWGWKICGMIGPDDM